MFCSEFSPSLTYIGEPKGETSHLSIESSTLGSSLVSTFFCDGPIKLAYCKMCEQPQLVNMKQNKHPHINYVLKKILLLPLTQAKNDDEQFWKEKFHTANGNAQHAHGAVFSFCGWGGVGSYFSFFFLVPNMFHHVP